MAQILKKKLLEKPPTIDEEDSSSSSSGVTSVETKEQYNIVPCPDVMEDICRNTKMFSLLAPDFCKKMFIKICYKSNATGRVCGTLDAPESQEAVANICGNGGMYLKKTADLTGAFLIWYHHPKNAFLVWAESDAVCRDSINRIRTRIQKCVDTE
mgnify:FL=1